MNFLKKIYWKKLTDPYPWSFMGFMLLIFIIPKLYDLSNLYWIGRISFEALAITEQFEFVAVSIEIVNETIPFGVLALVAQNYKNRDKILSILKAGLTVQIFFSIFLMFIVVFLNSKFVSTIGTPVEIVETTKTYLILKSVALPFESIAFLLLIGIKSMRKGKEAMYLVLFSVILNMVLDLILISDRSFSFHLGIQGVAIGYVISKLTLMTISVVYLGYIMQIHWPSFIKETEFRHMFKPLFKIGGWTGLDSLTRNLGYIGLLIVLNIIGINQFGGYGLAMWVMWTLIIPVLALAEGTNVAVGNLYGEKRYDDIQRVIITSMLFAFLIMLLIGFLGIFSWEGISRFFNPNPDMINYSAITFWWLIIPYILFGVGIVIKSLFIGTGETRYIFYISLVANAGIIAPFILLAKMGVIPSTYTSVMILFFIVFVEDIIVTFFFANKLVKRISGKGLLVI
jgi:Na+-driven multidrug efflux pump